MSSFVTKQLSPMLSMSLYPSQRTSRQSTQDCNHTGRHCNHVHARYRTALFSGVVFLLTLAVILALSLSDPGIGGRAIVEGGWTDGSLLRRQAADSEESPFVKNKRECIVIIEMFLHRCCRPLAKNMRSHAVVRWNEAWSRSGCHPIVVSFYTTRPIHPLELRHLCLG